MNDLPQPLKVHLYGFSPVWIRICFWSEEYWVKCLAHSLIGLSRISYEIWILTIHISLCFQHFHATSCIFSVALLVSRGSKYFRFLVENYFTAIISLESGCADIYALFLGFFFNYLNNFYNMKFQKKICSVEGPIKIIII